MGLLNLSGSGFNFSLPTMSFPSVTTPPVVPTSTMPDYSFLAPAAPVVPTMDFSGINLGIPIATSNVAPVASQEVTVEPDPIDLSSFDIFGDTTSSPLQDILDAGDPANQTSFVSNTDNGLNFYDPTTKQWTNSQTLTPVEPVDWSGGLIDLSAGMDELAAQTPEEIFAPSTGDIVGMQDFEYTTGLSQAYEQSNAQTNALRNEADTVFTDLLGTEEQNALANATTTEEAAAAAEALADKVDEVKSSEAYTEAQTKVDESLAQTEELYSDAKALDREIHVANMGDGWVGDVVDIGFMATDIASGGMVSAATNIVGGLKDGDLGQLAEGIVNLGTTYLTTEAKALTNAANSAATTGDWAKAADLSNQVETLKDTKSAITAVQAASSGNYGAALVSGLDAAGINLTEEILGTIAPDAELTIEATDDPFDFTPTTGTTLLGIDAYDLADIGAGAAIDLASGKDPESVVKNALVQYVTQADLLGESDIFETPEFLKEFDDNVIQPALQAVEDTVGVIADTVVTAVKETGEVLEPVWDAIDENVVNPIEEIASVIDDEVVQPIINTVEDAAEVIYEAQKPVGQAVADVVEPVVNTVGDVVETVYEAQKPVGQAVADVAETIYDEVINPLDNWVDDVELPSVNLPDIDWKGLFGGLIGGMGGMFAAGMQAAPQAPQEQQKAIQTKLQDYKPITPYRSKLSPSARLFG